MKKKKKLTHVSKKKKKSAIRQIGEVRRLMESARRDAILRESFKRHQEEAETFLELRSSCSFPDKKLSNGELQKQGKNELMEFHDYILSEMKKQNRTDRGATKGRIDVVYADQENVPLSQDERW
jgi:hypothetical protein